jgi:cytosine/creatinine deaminase
LWWLRLDLLIRNARLLDREGLVEIGVKNGVISNVAKGIGGSSEKTIDAKGNLVLPTFVEPHVHLDKVLLAERMKEATTISEAREAVKIAKKSFIVEDVQERMERVISWALESGVTVIRTHIDVDSNAKTTSVEAVLRIKKKYQDVLDLQIVAFPQEGIVKDGQALELIRKAIDLGAQVIGGLPEAEISQDDSKKHIDQVISIAKEKNLDLDVHCDVLPQGNNIEYFALQVLKSGLRGRATADHLIALSYYSDEQASKIIELIRQASMNVVTNPCTMISSGATKSPPIGRGITRVKELMKSGVNVAFGSDNIVDPYNPLGDFNPLSTAFLLTYGGQLSLLSELESIVEMPTHNSAAILRLQKYGIEPGHSADLNVFGEPSSRELIRKHSKPLYVVKRGKVIAESTIESVRHFAT